MIPSQSRGEDGFMASRMSSAVACVERMASRWFPNFALWRDFIRLIFLVMGNVIGCICTHTHTLSKSSSFVNHFLFASIPGTMSCSSPVRCSNQSLQTSAGTPGWRVLCKVVILPVEDSLTPGRLKQDGPR